MTERTGKPIVVEITADQRHERPQASPLLEVSLDRMWPDAVAGDKGVRASELRAWLQAPDIAAVISYRAADGRDQTLTGRRTASG